MLEMLDAEGAKYQVLHMICLGTCFQLAQKVCERDLDSLRPHWVTLILCSVTDDYKTEAFWRGI